MKRKYTGFVVLLVVLIALITLSVNTVFAGSFSRDPQPDSHAPICYKVNSYLPGVQQLQCYDVGKDIANVEVKTQLKYELLWDNETVTLRVFPSSIEGGTTFWYVSDKAGDAVSGVLP